MMDGNSGLLFSMLVSTLFSVHCIHWSCSDAEQHVVIPCDLSEKMYTALQWRCVEHIRCAIQEIKVCGIKHVQLAMPRRSIAGRDILRIKTNVEQISKDSASQLPKVCFLQNIDTQGYIYIACRCVGDSAIAIQQTSASSHFDHARLKRKKRKKSDPKELLTSDLQESVFEPLGDVE